MIIVIAESASDDIAEGYLFYEKQYLGLGEYFETSIMADNPFPCGLCRCA